MKEYKFKVDGITYISSVEEMENGKLVVTVNGRTFTVQVSNQKSSTPKVIHHVVHHVGSPSAPSKPKTPTKLMSPMPGTVIKINIEEGQKVKEGDVLLVIETMKMANDIVAEADGTVKEIAVRLGQNVIQGDLLVDFEGAEEAIEAAPLHGPVGSSKQVLAPLPGTVKQVLVSAGQEIKAGDTVVTMEAMKMENNIAAENGGKVKAVPVKPGDQVNQGDVLVELE
ncbi:MAG: biotin/lipoyl-binding protein [Prevotellaceae bacterium]|nr:biotin/lipoyl-binding protein [Prevotellaceae bacterium]